MRSRSVRFGLVAGAAALAVFVMAAAPSSALPPPGDDGESPIDRPPPTRPPTTTTTTPPTAPRVLNDLTVTTDSVVATATVRYGGANPGVVTIEWGDGTSSSRNPIDPVDSPFPDPWATSDPPGIAVFQHTYAAPSDGAQFPVAITARIGTESQTRTTTVAPRYRVTQSDAVFKPLVPCDSPLEPHTEWRVERWLPDPDLAWEFDLDEPVAWIGSYPGTEHTLAGSAMTLDVTAGGRRYYFDIEERDPIDDAELEPAFGTGGYVDLDPALGSRSVTLSYLSADFFNALCRAQIATDIDVRLLTPGVRGGPIASQ